MANFIARIDKFLKRPVYTSSLAFFRILFGTMMLISLIRFWVKGWIEEFYVKPVFHFTYYGFEWVHNPGSPWIYIVFAVMILCSVLVIAGLGYRVAVTIFFICFTYVELIDKANYLNHYYFISLVSFLMIFVPAHRSFSLDSTLNKKIRTRTEPMVWLFMIQLQVALVYIFGGIAKLKYDWLVEAMPLKIWLNANAGLPLIGHWIAMPVTAYIFSYAGLLFDLFVPFILWSRRWKWIGYTLVIIFHVFTHLFFYIGMFPFFMMMFTLVFLDTKMHHKIMSVLGGDVPSDKVYPSGWKSRVPLFFIFFLLQVLIPFRYLLYPGNNLWHEQAYRWSWNIMLMEKNGDAEFTVFDKRSERSWIVKKKEYLTPQQDRMLSTQPDMILQFAHFIKQQYEKKYNTEVGVKARVYVALNGRPSRLLIDPEAELTLYSDGFKNKPFILE